MKQKILDLTKQLIVIESIPTDIKKLNKIISFVENYIKENTDNDNFYLEKLEFENKPTLIIKNFGGKKADIVLNGHLDVVNPNDGTQFSPYEKNGKLYGRGAGDMKSGCAIMIELMIEILNSNYSDKKIMLILNTDEEVGGFNGAGEIVKQGYYGDVILIPDGGSLKKIITKGKGVSVLNFTINGKACHSSMPWHGENAIEGVFQFYKELKKEIENTKIIYGDGDKWGTSVALTEISGGKSHNAIPGEAFGTFNIRFTEKYTSKKIIQIAKNLIKKYDGEISCLGSGEVFYTEKTNKKLNKYFKIAKKENIENIELGIEHGASDGRFFAEKGSVVILHRPTCYNIHGKDEHVIIDDFEKIYNTYKEFIYSK